MRMMSASVRDSEPLTDGSHQKLGAFRIRGQRTCRAHLVFGLLTNRLTCPETFSRPRSARARAPQACTPCRTAKTRCDSQTPTRSPCAERSRRCVFPTAQRTRGPGKSKQRPEALEARLAAIESGSTLQATLITAPWDSFRSPARPNSALFSQAQPPSGARKPQTSSIKQVPRVYSHANPTLQHCSSHNVRPSRC